MTSRKMTDKQAVAWIRKFVPAHSQFYAPPSWVIEAVKEAFNRPPQKKRPLGKGKAGVPIGGLSE